MPFKKKYTPWNKNKSMSKETRAKMSVSRKGKKPFKMTDEIKNKISNTLKGRKPSMETRKKISEALKGDKSPHWLGGITNYKRKLFLNLRRRSLKLNAEGYHTEGEWELLKKQYGYKCPCCGKIEPEVSLTEDHIIPLSKGGSDFIENIQPLCKSCNCKKHTKIIDYRRSI